MYHQSPFQPRGGGQRNPHHSAKRTLLASPLDIDRPIGPAGSPVVERPDGDLERRLGYGRIRTTMATASAGRDGSLFLLGLAETAFRVFQPLHEPLDASEKGCGDAISTRGWRHRADSAVDCRPKRPAKVDAGGVLG